MFDQTGTVIPLADFLYADVLRPADGRRAARRLPGHPRGRRRAVPPPVVRAGDHRLAALDRRGPPTRCRASWSSRYKTEDEVPQYSVTIRKWNLKAKLPEALFQFTPPDGARRDRGRRPSRDA
ncbi:MAG: DUF2092 domain-containing protein [Chromatiales bacterium]|nr:DUF2092 domain-containing protein [Chromatiales bacterium]